MHSSLRCDRRKYKMNKDFANAEVECLIFTVKNYPELWDHANKGFKNKYKRRAAWNEVCKVFREDFESYSETEQNNIVRKFMSKWKNLKDASMKAHRINTMRGKARRRQYLYEKELSFLYGTNSGESSQANSGESSQITDQDQSEGLQSSIPTNYHQVGVNKKSNLLPTEQSHIEYLSVPAEYQKQPEIDEDTSFFNSVLPLVKQFDIDQKLDFRSEVLNIIKKIRQSRNNSISEYVNTNAICSEIDIKQDLS
ncbi:uncharacterized protein [Diabrotica undecimpunctata]|uniref:uncharacterized protein n=1 Tax=Diabrotica undecimpunctata TaxID=50387 RepID=UPI003B63C2C3